MLLSKKWLSEFVRVPDGVTDADLARTVTLSTVEVERTVDLSAAMEHMVVGLVVAVSPHPNADRLRVCRVDVGGRVTQIVCGGTNVAEGMKVAVALPGARVRWHGEGELVELAKTKIRGEESEGMICAGVEIGMEKNGEGEHEIMDAGYCGKPAGTPLAEALGRDDVIFEIEHKSLTNRPDLMGHYGMAREIAALYRVPLAPYAPPSIASGRRSGTTDASLLSVSVEDAGPCPRYMAAAVDGVTVGPSPAWLRDRLLSCGVRSINNVVDVTNFVMLELGQPMHAFDADVAGNAIAVRRANDGETIACLDGATYALDADDLLVTDGERPLAVAGVMGGAESGVSNATTRVVFESANFNPVSVRKTSTRLGLRSESSARFEKSLDPELCPLALARATELLLGLCPDAKVASRAVDVYPNPPKPAVVSLSAEEISARLGTDVSEDDATDILSRLGFGVAYARGSKSARRGAVAPPITANASRPFDVTVPTWRATKDVSVKEDVVEEVARIWGYDRIESALPSFSIAPPEQDPVRLFARRLRRAFASQGAVEAYRYAFVSPESLRALGFDPDDHLTLANPLAADKPYLVSSLVPNLLDTVAINHRAFPSVCAFEVERVFVGSRPGDEDGRGGALPAQPYHAGVAFSAQGDDVPFVEIRRLVSAALLDAGVEASFRPSADPAAWMHPARAADIVVGGTKCGTLAEALPEAAARAGIDRRVAVAEMNVSELASRPSRLAAFSPLPSFPDAKRDLAFVVDDAAAYADVESAVRAASPLLASVELFDVYRGKGVGEGKKSMAIHLAFRSPDRTLSSDEADQELAKVVRAVETQFRGTIRG